MDDSNPNSGPVEQELRARAVEHPLDPAPITQIGLLRLEQGEVAEASLYFRHALSLSPDYEPALAGLTLTQYLSGMGVERIPGAECFQGFVLQPRISGFLAALEGKETGSISQAPASLIALSRRNLTAQSRVRELLGVPRVPPVGRDSIAAALLEATAPQRRQSVVLVASAGVDPAAVCEAVLPEFLVERDLKGCGGAVWQAFGSLKDPLSKLSLEEAFEELASARRAGYLLFHQDLALAISELDIGVASALLGTGCLLCAVTQNALDRIFAVVPALRFRLHSIQITPLGKVACRDAFRRWRAPLQGWLGAQLDARTAERAVTLAEHYMLDAALPESAVQLLRRAFEDSLDGEASLEDRLLLSAARAAGLPETTLQSRVHESAEQLAEALLEVVGSQREACREVARAVVLRCNPEGIKSRPERPDAAFLFLGPPGVGKNTLARALAEKLFGPGRLLVLDLSSVPADPAYLFGHPGAGSPPGRVQQFLAQRPFAVVHLEHADVAPFPVLAALANLLNNGSVDAGAPEPTIRRAVFILSIDGEARGLGQRMGFAGNEEQGRTRDREGGAATYFPEVPALLRTLTVIGFDKLSEMEYLDLVRKRVHQIAVDRLRRERDVLLTCDEEAIAVVARKVRASGLSGERLQALVEQMVLVPLWPLLDSGHSAYRLVTRAEGIDWIHESQSGPDSSEEVH